ncbi:MAG: hypothetical protein RLZ12_938 [Bacillota bacterium]|jgi:hypothetical protein
MPVLSKSIMGGNAPTFTSSPVAGYTKCIAVSATNMSNAYLLATTDQKVFLYYYYTNSSTPGWFNATWGATTTNEAPRLITRETTNTINTVAVGGAYFALATISGVEVYLSNGVNTDVTYIDTIAVAGGASAVDIAFEATNFTVAYASKTSPYFYVAQYNNPTTETSPVSTKRFLTNSLEAGVQDLSLSKTALTAVSGSGYVYLYNKNYWATASQPTNGYQPNTTITISGKWSAVAVDMSSSSAGLLIIGDPTAKKAKLYTLTVGSSTASSSTITYSTATDLIPATVPTQYGVSVDVNTANATALVGSVSSVPQVILFRISATGISSESLKINPTGVATNSYGAQVALSGQYMAVSDITNKQPNLYLNCPVCSSTTQTTGLETVSVTLYAFASDNITCATGVVQVYLWDQITGDCFYQTQGVTCITTPMSKLAAAENEVAGNYVVVGSATINIKNVPISNQTYATAVYTDDPNYTAPSQTIKLNPLAPGPEASALQKLCGEPQVVKVKRVVDWVTYTTRNEIQIILTAKDKQNES